MATTVHPLIGAPSARQGKVALREYREGDRNTIIRSPGQLRSWLLKGLSRMRGNSHVRFLGGPRAGNSPGLPGGSVGALESRCLFPSRSEQRALKQSG
jgi:hypothetical protein